MLGLVRKETAELYRARLAELQLLKTPIGEDGYIRPITPGPLLYHGRFNLAWFDELGMRPIHGSPRVIFDVGAYDGGDAARFKLKFPAAEVYAFEADPKCFGEVGKNLAGLGVKCVCAAVCSAQEKSVPWYTSASDTRSQGSMFRHTAEYQQTFPKVRQIVASAVEAIRLDSFCAEREIEKIDLLHMDVEGAETEVARGLGFLRPKLIFTEALPFPGWIGPGTSSAEQHKFISSLGYILLGDWVYDRLYLRADLARYLSA
jgi:FkbM family methyltransferase